MPEDRRGFDPWAPPPAPDAGAEQSSVADEPTAGTVTDNLEDMSRTDLIELAERHDVPTYGSKAAIAARIREAQGNG